MRETETQQKALCDFENFSLNERKGILCIKFVFVIKLVCDLEYFS